METKRLFISIPLPDTMKEALATYMQAYQHKSELKQGRWCAQQNLHITTLFLGNIDKEILPKIELAITEALQMISSFDLPFDRVCFMPNTNRPHMIWAQFAKNDTFSELILSLKKALEPIIGMIEEERKPIPHVTLARLKHFFMKEKIRLTELQLPPLHVSSCDLMASTLSYKGPEYTHIKKIFLQKQI